MLINFGEEFQFMYEKAKYFLCGALFATMISCVTIAASPTMREIFFGVRVSFNGEPIIFEEDTLPFIMNGRTFLPVRTVADITGLNVDFFDGVVMLTSPGAIVVAPCEWRSNVFVSEKMGLSFAVPSNWNINASPQPFVVEATSPSGVSVRISEEKISNAHGALQSYIENMLRESTQMGMSVRRNLSDVAIGENYWNAFQATMEMSDINLNVYGHYFINLDADIARVITIIRPDISESLEEILKMFS
jgi:hypothetical protein